MSWLVLVVSGLLEAVWATALGRTAGFTRVLPSVVFLVACAASMGGLAYALRTLPVGTAYAVWVGIGAGTTVAWAIASGAEAASPLRILLVLGLLGCVIGLKLTH